MGASETQCKIIASLFPVHLAVESESGEALRLRRLLFPKYKEVFVIPSPCAFLPFLSKGP